MKALILCGGKGTRSYPFTEYYPKVMLPVGGTPVIVHLMRIYAAQGFREFVLAVGYRKEILLDYFKGRFPDWTVRIVDTGEDADTGERILRCAPYVGDTFFATYGDGLGDIDLHKLRDFHHSHGGVATVTSVQLKCQYGTLVFDPACRVEQFREKPVIPDCWINAGFFVFNKSVFSSWRGRNLETDVLTGLAREGTLYTYLHRGFWKSMDTTKDQREFERALESGNAPWVKMTRGLEPAQACERDEEAEAVRP